MKNSSGSENLRRVRLSPAAGTSTDTGDKTGWASGTSSLPSGSITVTVTKDSEGSQPTTVSKVTVASQSFRLSLCLHVLVMFILLHQFIGRVFAD